MQNRKIILFTVLSCFLLISVSKIPAVKIQVVDEELKEKYNEQLLNVLNGGFIDWLIDLILRIIELIKKPFETLETFFENLSNLFNELAILMQDLIKLIDWIVRKAIVAVVISIIFMILGLIDYLLGEFTPTALY